MITSHPIEKNPEVVAMAKGITLRRRETLEYLARKKVLKNNVALDNHFYVCYLKEDVYKLNDRGERFTVRFTF